MCLIGGQLPIWQPNGHLTALKASYWNWEAADLRHPFFYCRLSVLDFSLFYKVRKSHSLKEPNEIFPRKQSNSRY